MEESRIIQTGSWLSNHFQLQSDLVITSSEHSQILSSNRRLQFDRHRMCVVEVGAVHPLNATAVQHLRPRGEVVGVLHSDAVTELL